jgi:formate dehydrogenase major subunit
MVREEYRIHRISPRDHTNFGDRRATISLPAHSDDSNKPGCVFIPFQLREAAANILTTDALDPYGKIPEFKYCAVRVDHVSKKAEVATGPY